MFDRYQNAVNVKPKILGGVMPALLVFRCTDIPRVDFGMLIIPTGGDKPENFKAPGKFGGLESKIFTIDRTGVGPAVVTPYRAGDPHQSNGSPFINVDANKSFRTPEGPFYYHAAPPPQLTINSAHDGEMFPGFPATWDGTHPVQDTELYMIRSGKQPQLPKDIVSLLPRD